MEQSIFSFQQKNLVKKIFFLINLFIPSIIFVLHLNYLLITRKFMLNIKSLGLLVATNKIFDINQGRI